MGLAENDLGIPFECTFPYIKRLVSDEVEVLLFIPYLIILNWYGFFMQLSYYNEDFSFIAGLLKSGWKAFMTVFEA